MNRKIATLFLSLAVSISISATSQAETLTPSNQVRSTLSHYSQAVIHHQPQQACNWLTSGAGKELARHFNEPSCEAAIAKLVKPPFNGLLLAPIASNQIEKGKVTIRGSQATLWARSYTQSSPGSSHASIIFFLSEINHRWFISNFKTSLSVT